MAITVGTWNVERRLARLTDTSRGTPEHIVQGIAAIDADVLVLPEAFVNEPAPGVNEALSTLEYQYLDVRYDDKGRERAHAGAHPYMRVLSRLAIQRSEVVRFGDMRNSLVLEVKDPKAGKDIRIIPTHYRDEAEWMRMAQAKDKMVYHQEHSQMPTVDLGDFNALHGRDRRARLLSSVVLRHMVDILPGAKLQYLGQSTIEMGKGEVLAFMEDELGMIDLDTKHQPTMTPKSHDISERLPSIPLLQLDHIFVTRGTFEDTEVTVWPDGGSDHRALSTELRLRDE